MTKEDRQRRKIPIPESVSEIEQLMKERVGLGKSFDLGVRKLTIQRKMSIFIM